MPMTSEMFATTNFVRMGATGDEVQFGAHPGPGSAVSSLCPESASAAKPAMPATPKPPTGHTTQGTPPCAGLPLVEASTGLSVSLGVSPGRDAAAIETS